MRYRRLENTGSAKDQSYVVHEETKWEGAEHAIFQAVFAGSPTLRTGLDPRSVHVRFVVDKIVVGQVFSKYLDFSCCFSFRRLPHITDVV
jgi:hypothetical protein